MACGTPVVCSPVAASALGAQDGQDLLVGHDPHEFAEGVLSLLKNERIRARIGMSGRVYVTRHHDWSATSKVLEGIYDELINTK
jgi:glycosyltransferase involved in cell wall biosynthesis